MNYNTEEIRYLSSDGEHKIYAKIMWPNGEIKGIIQICHGMGGYISKYDYVSEKFVDAGYVVCGNTFLGHCDSVNSENDFGFFGEFNGHKYLVGDVKKLTQIVKEKFPNKDFFILGHSMGSLVLRCYITKYGDEINGAIFSGTIGPQPLVDSGIQLANMMIQNKGYRYRSRKLHQVMFQMANKEIENPNSIYEWVTSRKENVISQKSKFLFTVTGLRDIMILIKKANDPEKIEKIPKKLPLYFFCGEEDPISEYGDGMKRAIKLYEKAGIEMVDKQIYKGDRHECLNETNRDEVIENVIEWINKIQRGEN